ncbi:MAG TPA: hypothetical protein VFT64_10100 [Rickettsiales bacterium]|nr:hypothetical protein [Rickettsiales bacterium]
MAEVTNQTASAGNASPKNRAGQDGQEQKEHQQRTGSRLTVAGIAAFVGADLAIRVPLLYNLVTGKGREQLPADGNFLQKAIKSGVGAFKQKNTAIAAAAGALALGTLGWIRGKDIERPTDMVRHPLQSAATLFGIKSKNNEADKQETAPPLGVSPQSGILDINDESGLLQSAPGLQMTGGSAIPAGPAGSTQENSGGKWQQKAAQSSGQERTIG